mmetsp:Transcript_21058/g.65459  ORF Transcript_21058/g.65459 Transcript_21058/m.65459 type:complete len:213 (-) Transcript_21058:237-875(-)
MGAVGRKGCGVGRIEASECVFRFGGAVKHARTLLRVVGNAEMPRFVPRKRKETKREAWNTSRACPRLPRGETVHAPDCGVTGWKPLTCARRSSSARLRHGVWGSGGGDASLIGRAMRGAAPAQLVCSVPRVPDDSFTANTITSDESEARRTRSRGGRWLRSRGLVRYVRGAQRPMWRCARGRRRAATRVSGTMEVSAIRSSAIERSNTQVAC